MSGIEVAAWLGKALSTSAEKVLTVSGVAAIGRLIGATADIPTALLEGLSQGIRDQTEAKSLVTKSIAQAAAERVAGDPAIMERALNTMLQRQYRAQENKEAVAKVTVEALRSSPPISDNGGPSEQFMTDFERYAENAASDDLRTMFGRLLAGEIRDPGSVSPSAMQMVSMLDKETAVLIQQTLSVCGDDAAFLDCIDPKLNVAEVTYLEQAGFWAGGKILPISFNQEGTTLRLTRAGEGYVSVAKPNSRIDLSIAILSRAGRDLVKATEVPFDYERMAQVFFNKGATYFHAGKAKREGDFVSIPKDDILKGKNFTP